MSDQVDQQNPPTIEQRIRDALELSGRPLTIAQLRTHPGLIRRTCAEIRLAANAMVKRGDLVEGWLPSRRFYARDTQRITFALKESHGRTTS